MANKRPKPFSRFAVMRSMNCFPFSVIPTVDIPEPRGLQFGTMGFVEFARDTPFVTVNNGLMLTFKQKKKVLPKSIIDRTLEKKKNSLETQMGTLLPRKVITELREEVIEELLSVAMYEESFVRVMLLFNAGFVGNTLILCESTATSDLEGIAKTLRLLNIKVESNKGFGERFLNETSLDALPQNIETFGECVFEGVLKTDTRKATLKNYHLDPELIQHYISDSMYFSKANYKVWSGSDEGGFTLDSNGFFSKVDLLFDPEYDDLRDTYNVEQINILALMDFVMLLFTLVNYELLSTPSSTQG